MAFFSAVPPGVALPQSGIENSPRPPLRVALCITELGPGGAERCLVELALGLDRREFEPAVFCLAGPPSRTLLPDRLLAGGLPLTYLDASGVRHAWRTLRRLRAALASFRPDVVQSFLFHANLLARLAVTGRPRPAVVAGIRVAEREQTWHLWLERATRHKVDRHVCVSQGVAEFAIRRLALKPEQVLVIHNAVDAAAMANATPADLGAWGIPADHQAFLFVGRLERQKGLREFLTRLTDWLRPWPTWHLLLAGAGSAEAELRRCVANSEIESRVHFLGWSPNVPGLLAAAKVLILPSQWEGMPNVVLEAMAAGKPVVAMGVEGVAEALGPDYERQVATAGDWAGFGSRLLELIANPKLREDLGRRNQDRARAEFSPAAMVAAYATIYRNLRQ